MFQFLSVNNKQTSNYLPQNLEVMLIEAYEERSSIRGCVVNSFVTCSCQMDKCTGRNHCDDATNGHRNLNGYQQVRYLRLFFFYENTLLHPVTLDGKVCSQGIMLSSFFLVKFPANNSEY